MRSIPRVQGHKRKLQATADDRIFRVRGAESLFERTAKLLPRLQRFVSTACIFGEGLSS